MVRSVLAELKVGDIDPVWNFRAKKVDDKHRWYSCQIRPSDVALFKTHLTESREYDDRDILLPATTFGLSWWEQNQLVGRDVIRVEGWTIVVSQRNGIVYITRNPS